MSVQIPPLCEVHLKLSGGAAVNIAQTIADEWERLALAEKVSGKSIAVGVGSRGLARLPEMAREVVRAILASGGRPFIVPAMGSHGGATAAGQTAILKGLGITEKSVGCPIRATMNTVLMGHTVNHLPAYLDQYAAAADGILLINRVKPHTDFHAAHESGLLKMLAIGLGKEDGARLMHSSRTYGLREHMPEVGQFLLERVNLVAGFATVEDGAHQTVHLEAFTAETLVAGEQRLLEEARRLMPRLPVDDIDVLIVDRLGKEISGTGMDTNVIGRLKIEGEPEPESPRVKALVILDVTEASHGNALGVGLADFTVRRLVYKLDFALMTKHVFTSGFLERGRIPLVYDTDEQAIGAAIEHVFRAAMEAAENVRIVRIHDTLFLDKVWVSPNLLDEVRARDGFVSASPPQPLAFHDGQLF